MTKTVFIPLVAGALLLCGQQGCDIDEPPVTQGWPAEFISGVNYPWLHYGGDFGQNAWGHFGVSVEAQTVAADLRLLRAKGVTAVRWFVLTDGRAAPEFDVSGAPTGLEASVFADLDAALAIAEQEGVALMPVLLDFYWCAAAEIVGGVQLGGHAAVLEDPALRAQLIETSIVPLLERYGDHPNIIAWEIINEPEWAMLGAALGDVQRAGPPPRPAGLGGLSSQTQTQPRAQAQTQADQAAASEHGAASGAQLWLGDGVSVAAMRAFVAEATDAIHTHSTHPATVGSADLDWLQTYWLDSDLDVLQYHDYSGRPFHDVAAQVGGGRPVLLGEFPSMDPIGQTLDAALSGGFSGAWPWSYRAQDSASGDFLDELAAWNQTHVGVLWPGVAP